MQVVNYVLYVDIVRKEIFGKPVGRRGGVVSADGHQQLDIVLSEELEIETFLQILVRRFEAAHHQMRASAVVDVIRQEEIDVDIVGILGKKTLVALMQAYHPIPFGKKGLCNCSDDCVDSGGRTASCQNNDRLFHIHTFKNPCKISNF